MGERPYGNIVDFQIAAFNSEVAVAYVYDTTKTPRTPVARFYAEHRAYAGVADLLEGRIRMGDSRLEKLGVNSVRYALNSEDVHALGALAELKKLGQKHTVETDQ